MATIVVHFFIFLAIIFSNGILSKNFLIKNNFSINYFEILFIGIVSTSFLAQFVYFFFPLNNFILFINLILGLLIIVKNKSINFNKRNYFLIIFFFISFINIYASGFSDDINHYHASLIQNFDNKKIIIGMNSLHNHFGYASSWLYLHSYLNFNNTFLQDIHILNGIIFFLILVYFFSEVYNSENHNKLRILALFFLLFFLIKYTRLKEFGLDRPGVIFFCFINYFAFKYFKILYNQKNLKRLNTILIIFCLFLTSIKIFFIFSFIIPITFIIKDFVRHKKILINYIVPTFLLIIYILKNLLISGCFVYPFSFTCLEILPWNSKIIASELLLNTEAAAKGFPNYLGSLELKEFITGLNWVNTWIAKFSEEFLNYFYTVIFTLLLCITTLRIKKIKLKFNFMSINNLVILFIFILNILVFFKSPVTRYHHILFLSFGSLLIYLFDLIYLFRKKIFLIIVCSAFLFNISKNIVRIDEQEYINNPISLLKKQGKYYVPSKHNLGEFNYYIGWIDGNPIGNLSLNKKKYSKKFSYDIIY